MGGKLPVAAERGFEAGCKDIVSIGLAQGHHDDPEAV